MPETFTRSRENNNKQGILIVLTLWNRTENGENRILTGRKVSHTSSRLKFHSVFRRFL